MEDPSEVPTTKSQVIVKKILPKKNSQERKSQPNVKDEAVTP